MQTRQTAIAKPVVTVRARAPRGRRGTRRGVKDAEAAEAPGERVEERARRWRRRLRRAEHCLNVVAAEHATEGVDELGHVLAAKDEPSQRSALRLEHVSTEFADIVSPAR